MCRSAPATRRAGAFNLFLELIFRHFSNTQGSLALPLGQPRVPSRGCTTHGLGRRRPEPSRSSLLRLYLLQQLPGSTDRSDLNASGHVVQRLILGLFKTYSYLICYRRSPSSTSISGLRLLNPKIAWRVLDMVALKDIHRVALYCRVSTTDQNNAMQEADLRRMAEARGWEIITVVQEKISGRKTRPARERLIAEAKAGLYDAVMVWKLDRWGRSTPDLVNSIRELDACGVAFVSLKDGIDLSTPTGRLILTVLAAIAEFEADGIRERVTAGVRHAQKHGTRSGKAIGRPATAAGRSVEVRALRARGLSLPAIAAKTGLSYGSVHRLVTATPARHK